jgi:hypothetical protein
VLSWARQFSVQFSDSPLARVLIVVRASGGVAAQIAGGQTPYGIAVDESCVYWTDTGDGTVMKAPK